MNEFRSYFYKLENGYEQYVLKSEGQLAQSGVLGSSSKVYINNVSGDLYLDPKSFSKHGVYFNQGALVKNLKEEIKNSCYVGLENINGHVEEVSLYIKTGSYTPSTGIKTGRFEDGVLYGHPAFAVGTSGVTITTAPSGSSTGVYDYRGESGSPFLTGTTVSLSGYGNCIHFYPYWRQNPGQAHWSTGEAYKVAKANHQNDTAYKLCYSENKFIGVVEEAKFSVFGSALHWATGYHSGLGYGFDSSITGQLSSGRSLPLVAGATGFSVIGEGDNLASIRNIESGRDMFIIAPGYYSHTGTGMGYDENGIPSGSPSGEKITVTGIASGKYVAGENYRLGNSKVSQFKIIPCEEITGNYPVGVRGVSMLSISTPKYSDSGYAADFTIQTQVGEGGSNRFFMSSGAGALEETPSKYVLHRGYEYFFDFSHVTNYLNKLRFGYRPEATGSGIGSDMITGSYELNVPGSNFAYNNYILYHSPPEVGFTVPVSGVSHSYNFTSSASDTDHGNGNVGFYYGSSENTLADVEKIIISDYNADNIRITGWTDSLSGIGKYIGVHNSGDNNIHASYLITDIEKTDTYRKINVSYVSHNGSFSNGDKVILSPSGDGRIYYYGSSSEGHGGSGYFDITDSGNRIM